VFAFDEEGVEENEGGRKGEPYYVEVRWKVCQSLVEIIGRKCPGGRGAYGVRPGGRIHLTRFKRHLACEN